MRLWDDCNDLFDGAVAGKVCLEMLSSSGEKIKSNLSRDIKQGESVCAWNLLKILKLGISKMLRRSCLKIELISDREKELGVLIK